ncbi:MAG: exodeoxyribonuclease V subunit beta [Zoogloeaceae bacterium]|jgi:exodeoxyribonuclease V beta subunit|nr:exodeoxyribonuclease V subunit beta [Zoogloeaceae bacterium]
MNDGLDVLNCPLSGGTILIEASAGTGKTWAICALVLRFVLEQQRAIGEILILTFTRAATAELKERVRKRLLETMEFLEYGRHVDDNFIPVLVAALEEKGKSRAEMRACLRRALVLFDEAAIFTLHGFCQRVLSDTPFAAGQPFTQEFASAERGNDALLRETVADYWRQAMLQGRVAPALLDGLAAEKFNPDMLFRLARRALQKPLARALWPETAATTAAASDAIFAEALAAARRCWQTRREEIVALLEDACVQGVLNRQSFRSGAPTLWAEEWDAWLSDSRTAPSDNLQKFRQSVLDARTTGKQTPPAHPFFALAEMLCQRAAERQTRRQGARLALCREFLDALPEELAARKRRLRQVDFDDMLGNLDRALFDKRNGAQLAARLRCDYPVALIDEFQDTDPLQARIFERIYAAGSETENPATLFLVGDPKQAIFSFRMADLHTYLTMRDKTNRCYTLDRNQRSVFGILTGLNALFSANPRAFLLGNLDFRPARRGEKPLPDFIDASAPTRKSWQLWQLPTDEDGEAPDKRSAEKWAARATAEEIARLLDAARRGLLRKGDTPLTAKNMAVLVRTHAQGSLMRRALAGVGLQAAELTQSSVFASTEAQEVNCLLHALLLPQDTRRVKAALATTLIGWTATEIAALDNDTQHTELDVVLQRFQRGQRLWQEKGILAALSALARQYAFNTRLLRQAEGERRQTNVLHLFDLLHQAARTAREPEQLTRWYAARLAEPFADEASLLRLESERDLVQIVTIHKAKGLEFDVVFCPFFWEENGKPRNDGLPGCFYHDVDGNFVIDYRPDPEHQEDGKERHALEQAAESVRLLYVALTRPVYRCYLVWGQYKHKNSDLESRKSLLNWLAAGRDHAPRDWLASDGRSKTLPTSQRLAEIWQERAREMDADCAGLPAPGGRPFAAGGTDAPQYAALRAKRRLFPDWRMDSFSGLLRGARWGGEEQDSDGDATREDERMEASAVPPSLFADDPLLFPRGGRAGDCIHALFERIDFTDAASFAPAAAAALQQHPQPGGLAPERLAAMLCRLAKDVLSAPLPLPGGELRLHQLPRPRRLTEFAFHLPAQKLDPARLQGLMAAYGEPLPQLAATPLSGYLKGYIDLVFAHTGRYYVLDWKSNHLGFYPEDYAVPALKQVMTTHAYTLQARLYLLALHHYLQFRLPDYDPARHLGGACYLFIRALKPEWQTPDAPPPGIVLLAPQWEQLQALEQLMENVKKQETTF